MSYEPDCWCGRFRLISFVKRAFPMFSTSHNVGTQTTSTQLVLFRCWILSIFFCRFEKNKNGNTLKRRERKSERNAKSRIHLRATLITIKCFVFFRPFQLYKQKGVKKTHIHSPSVSRNSQIKLHGKCDGDVNISMNMWVCVCRSSSTSISRFGCCHCIGREATHICRFLHQTFWQQEREISVFFSFACKAFPQVQRTRTSEENNDSFAH